MVSIEDILKIDNCDIFTYDGHTYKHDDNYPLNEPYPPHEIWVDLDYPIVKNIHYSDLDPLSKNTIERTKEILEDRDLFLIPGYLKYGDYDNSCMVERSNQKVFLEDYEKEPGIFTITGGYGSSGIAISIRYLLNPDNEEKANEIINLLNGLNDYPCLDDEDMSNMEYEAFYESLDDYGVKDTCTALSRKYDLTVYDYSEEKLKELILDIDRNGNPVFIIESGGSCYIDIDDMIVPKITKEQFIGTLTDYEVNEE